MKLARGVRSVYTDPTCWQRYDDTLPALDKLGAKGWKHILLSNHVPELPMLLDRLDLTKYFAVVFNSAETGYEKPNHHAFRAVLDWMGPNATCWLIGDSYHADILGAQEMGMSAILVRTPHPQAAVYYETLTELAEKL
jgi:putative hydrolase of the HAD superfamily